MRMLSDAFKNGCMSEEVPANQYKGYKQRGPHLKNHSYLTYDCKNVNTSSQFRPIATPHMIKHHIFFIYLGTVLLS